MKQILSTNQAITRFSRHNLTKFLSLLFFACFLANAGNAQLLRWNTFANAGTETTEPSIFNDPNIASANLTLSGITPAANSNRLGGSGWFDTGNSNPSTLANAIAGNNYIQFVVTPNSGFSFTPTSFVFNWDRSSTGPSSVTLRSSADGFVSDLGTVSGIVASAFATNTITITGLSALNVATTFRLYGYNATATTGTAGLDINSNVVNVQLNGTTASYSTSPVIAVSGTPLSALSSTYGTASSNTTFSISALSLTAGILLTAPTGFEISTSSNSGFVNSFTLGGAGNIAATTIYVRLKANALVANSPYSGSITCTSAGATPVDVQTLASVVNPLALTIAGASVDNKVYDGFANATINGTLSGVIPPDNVSLTLSGVFDNGGLVGNNISVTSTSTISGPDVVNYILTQPIGLMASVTAAPLISQTISFSALTPVTYGDVPFMLNATASSNLPVTYTSSDTAVATVTPSGLVTIIGSGTTNITASQAGDQSYDIAPNVTEALLVNQKELTLLNPSVANKPYDGTTTATLTGTLTGLIVGDNITLTLLANFLTPNVGTAKVVNSVSTIGGILSSNYFLTQPTNLTADIVQASQTITFAALPEKGTTDAPFTLTATSNSGLPITYTSSNSAVATVPPSGNIVTIIGAGSTTITAYQVGDSNYLPATPVIQNLDVTAQLLRWNTFGNLGTETTEPSVFNDLNISTSNITMNGITPTTNANRLGGSGWFDTGNSNPSTLANAIAGNNYMQFIVTPNSGYAFTPTSFIFTWDRSSTGPGNVTLRSSADNYASDLGSINGIASSALISNTMNINSLVGIGVPTTFRLYAYGATATGGTGGFDVSTNKVNVQLNGTTAITTPVITVTGTPLSALSTTYGTASANTSFTIEGSYLTAGILLTAPAGFEISTTSNSGFVNSFTLGGAGNIAATTIYVRLKANALVANSPYSGSITCTSAGATPVDVQTLASVVNPLALTIAGASVDNKVYDGFANATINGTLSGVIPPDNVSLTLSGVFDNGGLVGNNISVTSTSTISGPDVVNYILTQPIGLMASVTAAPLISQTISFSALTPVTYGDVPFMLNATASSNLPVTYTSSDTAVATVTPSGLVTIIGSGTTNITASQAGDQSYDIAPNVTEALLVNQKELTILNPSVANKTYDGNTSATLTGTLSGIVNGDNITLTPIANFVSANAGTGIAVNSTSTITGLQAFKYYLTQPINLSADILQASQVITFNVLSPKNTSDAPFALTATSNSGLPINYTSSNTNVATIPTTGNMLTIVGNAGASTITAFQAGDQNYLPATPVSQTQTVLTFVAPGTPVNMAAQLGLVYTQDFSDISNWTNGFTSGVGAAHWTSVGVLAIGSIPSANKTTVSTATFQGTTTPSTSGGVHKGNIQVPSSNSIVLLATGSTDNSSSAAIDFLLDFTGVNAGTVSFDASTLFNSTGNRKGTLKVFASPDNSTWTELVGTNLPFVATNNVAQSASITNIALPASFNNMATARLRFYYYNGSGGTTGSRPKISIDNVTVTATPASTALSLKCFIQGYYLGAGTMTATIQNEDVDPITAPNYAATDCDNITVTLHEDNGSTLATYPIIGSFTGMLHTNGTISCTFPSSTLGKSCYIVIEHRNTIQTWSSLPITIASSNTYDFTTAASKALGSNQIDVAAEGIYSVYNGDINLDFSTDASDFLLMDADIQSFNSGYINTDLNGDGSTDASDFLILDGNIQSFVGAIVLP